MIQAELASHLSKFHSGPVLFIGSGMSRRFLGMETWKSLLEKMHEELNLSKPFGYYLTNSSDTKGPDLTRLASLMGNEFNEVWWTSDRFRESRESYQEYAKDAFSPLKFEISKYITNNGVNLLEGMEEEVSLLKNCQIDAIITTNWDMFLESLFPDFTSFIGQEQLIFSDVLSIGEIYKIHGSVSNPESLILTKEDYDAFHERNPYLASKLLNIFMEHPIIFMGYSLDDPNVQQILKSIIKILTRANIDKLKDRLLFCEWSEEMSTTLVQDSTLLIGETVLPIKLVKLNSYTEILKTLSGRKRRIPVKLLRHMKNMVYDFVKNTEGKSNFYVAGDLEKLQNLKNGDFVYGVGLMEQIQAKGIKGIDSRDLIRDAVIDTNLPAADVCKLILANATNQYLPYFKHLQRADFLDQSGRLNYNNECPEITQQFVEKVNAVSLSTFYPAASYLNKRFEVNSKYNSIADLRVDETDLFRQLMLIPLLEPKKIDLAQLRAFLKANIDSLVSSTLGTHFRKLVCLYDYLKYKYPLTQTGT